MTDMTKDDKSMSREEIIRRGGQAAGGSEKGHAPGHKVHKNDDHATESATKPEQAGTRSEKGFTPQSHDRSPQGAGKSGQEGAGSENRFTSESKDRSDQDNRKGADQNER